MPKEIGQLRLGPLTDFPRVAQSLQDKINEIIKNQGGPCHEPVLLTGDGPPPAGVDVDYYVDLVSGDFYGPG